MENAFWAVVAAAVPMAKALSLLTAAFVPIATAFNLLKPILAPVPRAYELGELAVVAPDPRAIEVFSNRATWLLFSLKMKACASVVPKKFDAGLVPAFPTRDQALLEEVTNAPGLNF